MKRNVGIDYLKALSIEFVLILHVGGFFKEQFVDGSICKEVDLTWHMLEAIAYPAIHIFVLISCYFWIEKTPSKRGGIKVWLQTFIICVGGLLVAIFFHVPFEIGVLFPILLPFSGRAYWFVTDYLFLLIIAPLLKNAIKDMNDVALKRYTFFLFIINSVMCFLFRTFA